MNENAKHGVIIYPGGERASFYPTLEKDSQTRRFAAKAKREIGLGGISVVMGENVHDEALHSLKRLVWVKLMDRGGPTLHERHQFVHYLQHTLIPDLIALGLEATADDFKTCIQFMK